MTKGEKEMADFKCERVSALRFMLYAVDSMSDAVNEMESPHFKEICWDDSLEETERERLEREGYEAVEEYYGKDGLAELRRLFATTISSLTQGVRAVSRAQLNEMRRGLGIEAAKKTPRKPKNFFKQMGIEPPIQPAEKKEA